MIKKFILLGTLIFLATRCASVNYRYMPADHVSSTSRWRDEALYSLPVDSPLMKVRIQSLGIVDTDSITAEQKYKSLHLRMAITNQSRDQIISFRSQDQFVSFPNSESTSPILTSLDKKSSLAEKEHKIPPNSLWVVDLFFKLPPSLQSESDLPDFDFHWQIKAGEKKISEVTLFDRISIPDAGLSGYSYPYYLPYSYPYPYYPYGGSTIWWTSPPYYFP